MKYLIKLENFLTERKDIEKREEILAFLNDIVLVIKNHFINIIDNLIKGKNIEDYIILTTREHTDNKRLSIKPEYEIDEKTLEIDLDKKHKFKIVLELYDGTGSYAKNDNGSNFLFICLGEEFNELLKDIFITRKTELAEIKNKIKNYKLEKNVSDILFHELIHATDDMKFDIVNDFRKVTKLLALKTAGKGFEDPEFTEEYFKNYPNFTTEYNAYFMMATNILMYNIKNNIIDLRKLKDFKDFKEYFINLTKKWYIIYNDTTKFKKHYDNRMYDLYTKIKEKYL